MKIILSPSKTQNIDNKHSFSDSSPIYLTQAEKLNKLLKQLSKDELKKIMKIEGSLLETTYYNIQIFETLPQNHAISSYTGMVFKQLNLHEYTDSELKYLNDHLVILSALYGYVRPFDLIKPYRLDLTMKIKNINLYSFYSERISDSLKNETIINLASSEFSKLVNLPMITIDFLVNKSGVYKNIGTYAKQARGKMLDFIIRNQIKSVHELKSFNDNGFLYNALLSSDNNLVFTKN